MFHQRLGRLALLPVLSLGSLGLLAASCDSDEIKEIIDNLGGRGGSGTDAGAAGKGGAGGTTGGAGGSAGTAGGAGGSAGTAGGAGGSAGNAGGAGGTAGSAGGTTGGAGGSGGSKVCGGIQGIQCGANEFCEFPAPSCGRADMTGVCRATGGICPAIYQPVCGCDGKTYGNDCTRAAAGVSKQADGECSRVVEVGEGESCGGFRLPPQRVCAKGLKCNDQPGRCGSQAADAPGICEAVPQACTKEFRPVCGCDGKTYGNDCMRKAAGVSLNHEGECRTRPPGRGEEGATCDGIAGLPCNRGLFCEHEAGMCQVADGAGKCTRTPQACDLIRQPVCGCDGKTYGNDCARQIAGVPKNHDGACR